MLLNGPTHFDLSFSQAIQAYQPSWLTWLAKIFTYTSQPEIIVPVILLISFWLLWRHQSRRELILVGLILGNGMTVALKPLFGRPRPDPQLIHTLMFESGLSFPSGHAIASVLTAATIWILFRTKRSALLHVLLLLYILIIGWSRVYLGVHWVSDVLAGYILAAGWILFVHLVVPLRKK